MAAFTAVAVTATGSAGAGSDIVSANGFAAAFTAAAVVAVLTAALGATLMGSARVSQRRRAMER
jgi:hypothetical protein